MSRVGFNMRSIGLESSALDCAKFAADNGIGALELDGRSLWHNVLIREEIRELKILGARYGIDYSIHFPWVTYAGSLDLEQRRQNLIDLEGTIRFADDITAKAIVVHPPYDFSGVPESERGTPEKLLTSRQLTTEFFQHASRTAEDCGVRLCIENGAVGAPESFFNNHHDLVQLVEDINSPCVGICLDVGHAGIWGDGVDVAFETFRPHIRHYHMHDWILPKNGQVVGGSTDHYEVGVEGGNLDLAKYISILQETQAYMMTMEVGHSAVIEEEAQRDPKEMVIRSRKALIEMIPGLAQ